MTNVLDLIEIRDGWVWPKIDVNCWEYMKRYPNLPDDISKFVKNKNVVVQAGGNCGVYPKQYANLFKRVYTFEPEWLNFYCLNQNVSEGNVIKIQSCLGDKPKMVSLAVNKRNRGKTHIKGTGQYPVFQIDSLGLDACDLIHLDIEGYEYFALLGASSTIEKYKPVVVVEMWDELNDRFGENLNLKTTTFLEDLGYSHITTLANSDKVFIHESIHNQT